MTSGAGLPQAGVMQATLQTHMALRSVAQGWQLCRTRQGFQAKAPGCLMRVCNFAAPAGLFFGRQMRLQT